MTQKTGSEVVQIERLDKAKVCQNVLNAGDFDTDTLRLRTAVVFRQQGDGSCRFLIETQLPWINWTCDGDPYRDREGQPLRSRSG
jgi:hypothetical protein